MNILPQLEPFDLERQQPVTSPPTTTACRPTPLLTEIVGGGGGGGGGVTMGYSFRSPYFTCLRLRLLKDYGSKKNSKTISHNAPCDN